VPITGDRMMGNAVDHLSHGLRLLLRHRRTVSGALALASLLLGVAGWIAAGTALQNWAVGLGMDEERGALLAALLITAAGTAVTALASGRTGAPRAGAILAFAGVEIGPFLVRGTRVVTTPGLSAHLTLWGWFVQPVGMMLLATAAISLGAAGGALARRDLAVLVRLLRRRTAARAAVPVVGLLVYLGAGAAAVALQDGPVSALYGYSQPVAVRPPDGVSPLTTASPTPTLGPAAPAPDPGSIPAGSVRAAPGRVSSMPTLVRRGPVQTPEAPSQHRPGVSNIDTLTIGGRHVNVYVPALYDTSPGRAFPVLYFLHGYPGNFGQWVGSGAQLPGVLDQLIASGEMPPVIAVQPDGNGQAFTDAEWGDDARGDHVERWLTTQVLPEIDGHYRTLGARYRGIAGLSAGGFGAVNIAIHHPDLFRWAGSYSGYFTARADIFRGLAAANSPDQTAATLPVDRRMPLFIGVGDTDREYVDANHRFVGQLEGMGWTALRSQVVGGGHGWEAWRAEMVDSLRWLGTLWGTAPGVAPAAPSPSPPASAGASPSPATATTRSSAPAGAR
jgi:enterochelin esterase-like enzyme